MKTLHLVAGHTCAGLGLVGMFVPLLPTTPFMLLAVYFYSRSSERLRDRILHHPRFGPSIREWRDHGAIRPRAKVAAVCTLAASFGATIVFGPFMMAAEIALGMGGLVLIAFIASRPSRPGK